MATSIEAQGHTVDEAIQIALNQLGVSRDKVEIDILHHPRRGLLGIGARRAKVRATIRESVMLDGEEFDMSGGTELDDKPRRRRRRGGRNRGGRGDDRPEGAAEASPRQAAPAPAPAGRDSGRNEGDRRGGRRGGEGEAGRPRGDDGGRQREDRRGGGRNRGDQRPERSGADARPDAQAPRGGVDQRGGQPSRPADEVREGGRQDGREGGGGRQDPRDRSSQRGGRQGQGPRDQGDRRDRGRGPRPPRPDSAEDIAAAPQDASRRSSEVDAASGAFEARSVPISTSRQNVPDEPPLDRDALEEIRAKAEDLVTELLKRMGFAAEVSSSVDEAAGEAVISVRSESEGLLIGRRGQTLDSLEHLVNRMALRGDTQVEGRVLLDIGDYRKRRRESLDELATRLRSRAVGERRTVQVSPMSPRDRKFFAQAFADDESVEVRALGAGFYRRVIVAPAGMGAAAVAAAEAAGDHDEETIEVETGFSTAPAEN